MVQHRLSWTIEANQGYSIVVQIAAKGGLGQGRLLRQETTN